jgi:sulfatase modifying factor 1
MKELFRNRLFLPSVLLAAVVLIPLVPAVAAPPKGDKVALLVGISEYNHAKLDNLRYAPDDVEELAEVLRQAGYSRIVQLTTRTGAADPRLVPDKDNILRELADLLKNRTKYDTVLVAFSGHGVQLTLKDKDGKSKDEPFFCPRDGNPTKAETLVALNQVYADLDNSGAGVKLLLVDACRNNPADKGSKGIDGRDMPDLRKGMGALFSCRPGERSYEDKTWKHGAFFSVVLEALRPDDKGRLGADVNGDGVVDFEELTRYVSKHVPIRVKSVLGEEVEQNPLPVLTLDPLVPVVRLTAAAALPKTLMAKTVNMDLVLIKAGKFIMGSPDSDTNAYPSEKPRHEVTISQPFYLDKYEVTVGQFEAFVQDSGYQTDAEKDRKGGWGFNEKTGEFAQKPEYTWKNPGFRQGTNHPVVNVSWNDATAFCKWLSKKEGRTFQLPAEAQWEYACRGKSTKLRVSGDDVADLEGFANLGDVSLKRKLPGWPLKTAAFDDGYVFTAPVGQFKPNDFGLYDMLGNAWEWCLDGRRTYEDKPITDPVGPKDDGLRVMRGGSWAYEPHLCRAGDRLRREPATRAYDLGFRVLALPVAKTGHD